MCTVEGKFKIHKRDADFSFTVQLSQKHFDSPVLLRGRGEERLKKKI